MLQEPFRVNAEIKCGEVWGKKKEKFSRLNIFFVMRKKKETSLEIFANLPQNMPIMAYLGADKMMQKI